MKFYHGTTKENWKKIQEEGVLWGRPNVMWEGRLLDRATWLAVEQKDAECWNTSEVILEVEYEPGRSDKIGRLDNYYEGCWQVITYEPIVVDKVKMIKEREVIQSDAISPNIC